MCNLHDIDWRGRRREEREWVAKGERDRETAFD